MKAAFIGLSLLFLASCSSTGVILMDEGTYMISSRSAQLGIGPPNGTKAAIYKEANAFCAKKGMSVKTINLKVVDTHIARPGSVELVFRCE